MTVQGGKAFDYLFGGRGWVYSDTALGKLGQLMMSPPSEPAEGQVDPDDGSIPAGYTYLGQFIDHDLVFDETSQLDRLNDPRALRNTRSPRFDLDSLYGGAPAADPVPFDAPPGVMFRLGDRVSTDPRLEGPDLPRDARRKARIGDPRNDENLIISQLHSLLLRFHNAMARHVAAAKPTLAGPGLFEEARRQVRWHYQWVVVHDFLPRIVGQAMVDCVLKAGRPAAAEGKPPSRSAPSCRRFFDARARVFIPLEFSGAAYRFGHSMVRPAYRINAAIRRKLLTGRFEPNNLENLIGFRPLPQGWGVQWKYFFELGGNPCHQPMQRARRIDTQLENPLAALVRIVREGTPPSLGERNLRRGRALGLLSGQEVARAMGVSPIADGDLIVGPAGARRLPISEVDGEFADNAPLWYYVLREAEMEHNGTQLGPVGGRLVAETFIGLMEADPTSYLGADPAWTPDPALASAGRFGMPELIRATVEHL